MPRAQYATVITDDTKTFAQNITDAIITSAETTIKQTNPKAFRKCKSPPYWSGTIKEPIRERNRCRNKMNKTKNLHDRIEFKRKKGIAQREIKQTVRAYWQQYCSTLMSSTKLGSVWKMSRGMKNVHSTTKIQNVTLNDKTYDTNVDKSNLFADVFARNSSNENYSDEFTRRKADVETNEKATFIGDGTTTSDVMKSVNEPVMFHELRSAVGQCKANSAPGEDRISYDNIKQIPKSCQT